MARHKAPRTPAVRRSLAVLATAGSGARRRGGGRVRRAEAQVLPDDAGQVVGTVADLKPNPLAGTGVDPLDNGVATQVADFRGWTRAR